MQVGVELVNEDAARPAMLDRFANIKRTDLVVLQAVEQDAILASGNLCNKLLHNFAVRPRLGERAHVFEITS